MKREDFVDFLETAVNEIKIRLTNKGDEYASNNQFHNFIEGGVRLKMTPEQYLLCLNTKHEISVKDLVESYNWNFTLAHEKIHDIIAYNILLLAMIYERTQEQKDELPF